MFIQDLENARQKREDMQEEIYRYQTENRPAELLKYNKRFVKFYTLFSGKQQAKSGH